MSDKIQEFIEALCAAGCDPESQSDIQATGKIIRFQISGDKNGTRNGRCQLWVESEDFASAWFMNMREGVKHTWHSKANRKLTDEERREYARKREAEKKRRQREKAEGFEKAAEKAAYIWEKSERKDHPYLTRKKATGRGTKVYKGALVVPAYKNGKLTTLQFIAENGEKRFLTDGDIQGAYGSMGSDTSVLYISEGYATADAVFQATGKASVWAFNAGNLTDVAKTMREKYPDSQIVMAADNDRWSKRPDGSAYNAGMINAEKAAQEIGGFVAAVDVPDDDPERRTDWNDIYVSEGLDYVKNSIAQAMDRGVVECSLDVVSYSNSDSPPLDWLESIPPIEAYSDEAFSQINMYVESDDHDDFDPEWKTKLNFNDEGKLNAKSMNNVQLILANSPKFKDMFCYDEFAHEKILVQCPDWEKPDSFKPRPITDEDITWLTMSLERQGITLKMGEIRKVLEAVINKKRRNPAQEYFKSLKWDGVERLNRWLSYYAGCESEDLDYLAQVGTKWMVAAIYRVFEPGTKFDHVLVLEGGQGVGKSTMLRELATIRGRSYFDDTIKVSDLGTDKTIPKLQGVMIIELAEMAGMRKADIDNLKQQITIQEDRLVLKFKNEASRFPRQFVMAGTINPVQGYMDDPTGNRRFLPVKVGKTIDLSALKKDKEQLWAEAVELYRQRFPVWFDNKFMEKLRLEQESREIISPWKPDLEELCRNRNFVSNQDIWEKLCVTKSLRNQRDMMIIGKIMVSLGFVQSRKRVDGSREYGWVKE